MKRIEKLTPELEDGLAAFRENRRARGLRLDWATEHEIRQSVLQLYQAANLKKPIVLVLDSPLACLLARGLLRQTDVRGQLRDQLRDQLWGQLRDQLRGQLRDQLWGQLRDQLRGQLGGQLWGQLRDQLGGQLWGQLRDQLRDQLWGQLRDQLFESTCFAGGSEHYWTAFYRYCLKAGAKVPPELAGWLDCWETYADTAGALYPYEGIAFVSRRPTRLNFDAEQRLHAETSPAMSWKDGFSVYAWHGTRLPPEWVENRETIDPAEILKAENVEQRAAGAAMIGWPRMAEKLNRKVIDGDPESDVGALVELTLPGLEEPGRFLMAKCPRNGTICEGVPRTSDIDGLPINTEIAAQAWRDCFPVAEYTHPPIRT